MIFWLTYFLTCSMVQIPSWNANWFEDIQAIHSISRNPNVHYEPSSFRQIYLYCARPILSIYTHSTSSRSVRILSTHVRLGLPSGLFPFGFITKTQYSHSTHRFKSHSQPIIFVSILSPAQYWMRNTKHLAPRYATSIIRSLLLPSFYLYLSAITLNPTSIVAAIKYLAFSFIIIMLHFRLLTSSA